MGKLLKRHHISFQAAWAGIWWSLLTQPNFRIHLSLAVTVLAVGLWLNINRLEMIILIFTIILGLVAEMINTSLEAMTDLITQEWKQQAKIAKDVSAGMMLMVATGAVGIAIIIFVPYIHF